MSLLMALARSGLLKLKIGKRKDNPKRRGPIAELKRAVITFAPQLRANSCQRQNIVARNTAFEA
jgi:hypothetical protein